jgi:AcrR family transcriptional regulator
MRKPPPRRTSAPVRSPAPVHAPPAPRSPGPAETGRAARLPPAARREALLEAALPVFARLGWAGAGTRELSRAAGVTEPILYRHFDGKEGLYLAVLERALVRVADVLQRRAQEVRGAARLTALADALDEVLEQRLDELRVLAASASAAAVGADAPRIAAASASVFARLGERLASLLEDAGLKRGVDPRVAAGLLLEVGLGAAVLVPLGMPLVARDTFRAPALGLLVSALTGGPRPRA